MINSQGMKLKEDLEIHHLWIWKMNFANQDYKEQKNVQEIAGIDILGFIQWRHLDISVASRRTSRRLVKTPTCKVFTITWPRQKRKKVCGLNKRWYFKDENGISFSEWCTVSIDWGNEAVCSLLDPLCVSIQPSLLTCHCNYSRSEFQSESS